MGGFWVFLKEMFYLMMHSTYFIYGYMASDIYGKGETKPAAATWFFYMHHPREG